MADIRPFKGVRYNQQLVGNLAEVICAPSDILTPALQRELYHRNKYNFVRLDACVAEAGDKREDEKWQRAHETMLEWLDKGILQTDEEPAFYLHDYYFNYQGKQCRRRGLIAIVRLEEWEKMIIRRHERILPELKKSRLSQISHMKAFTSPLTAVYKDERKEIDALLDVAEKTSTLLVDLEVDSEGRHEVWAVSDAKLVKELISRFSGKSLYMADGHHRYESALAFRNEMRIMEPSASEEAPFNYVMMTLTSVDTCDLIVLPFNRLIRGLSESDLEWLPSRLGLYFEVDEWSLDLPDIWRKLDNLLTCLDPARDETVMALFGLKKNNLLILTVRDFTAIDREMPPCRSKDYLRLDVSIADHVIISKLLGMDGPEKEKRLGFSSERTGTVGRVSAGEYQLALLLRPPRIEQILQIADNGETMPEKATRFYPKVSTGFVFYKVM